LLQEDALTKSNAERDHVKAMRGRIALHSASRKTEPRSFCFAKLLECARVLAPLLLLVSSAVCGADDKPFWQIQKVLASVN
jgi:hypothetical protein